MERELRKVGAMLLTILMLVGGLTALVAMLPANDSDVATPIAAHITTKTGDTYNASKVGWHWYVYAPTVYDGSNEQVYGFIDILSGGLTFKNGATLMIDEASQYEFQINISAGAYFQMSNATLTTSNSSAGHPWVKVVATSTGNTRISNSTVEHYDLQPNGDGDWIDNNTMHSSMINAPTGALYRQRMNISYNTFDNLNEGRAITGGFALNSNITGNTIETSCVQVYSAGSQGWINVLGPFAGQSRGTSVIKNHIEATVYFVGIYLIEPNKVYVSRNIIDKVARNSNGTDYAGINAGIFLRGEGLWSSIDNNTIKHVTGDPTVGGWSGFNIAIAADTAAIHWNISYNKIWRIGSAENNSCLGIDYEGSHANIKGNNFTFVGLDQGPAYINTAGIIVENNFMGVYNPFYRNALNCVYVNTTWNHIDRVQAASNGITYGWALSGNNVTLGEVSNNTIGIVYAGSGGIGVYIHASHIKVLDNSITSVYHDAYGIGIATEVQYITVSRNTIHVVNQYLTNYGGDYYGEGISNWSEAAIMTGSETFMDSLKGCIFSYNDITIDSRSNGPGLLPYPDFMVHYCGENLGDDAPRFIVNRATNFVWVNSTLNITVILPSDRVPQMLLGGVTTNYSNLNGASTWRSNIPLRSYSYFNVTISGISVRSSHSLNLTILSWSPSSLTASAASWKASNTNPVESMLVSFAGLHADYEYTVTVDGVVATTITTDSTGASSWLYSGPWSVHTFSIKAYGSRTGGPIPLVAKFDYHVNGLSVSFTDKSTGNDVYMWLWDFGDGTRSTAQDPSHAYGSPGTYTVTLTIADSSGHINTITKKVVVGPGNGLALGMNIMLFLGLFVAGALIIIITRKPSGAVVGGICIVLGILVLVV